MFLRLTTQWNYTQGQRIGINYQSVEFLFKTYKVKNREEVMDGLRIMEFAALAIFYEKAKK